MKKNRSLVVVLMLMGVLLASCVKDEVVPVPEPDPPPPPGEPALIHYWHFNNLTGEVQEVPSDFSLVGKGLITYPGEGDGYMDARTYNDSNPVSNFNLRMGQEPDQGAVLRVRNPSIERKLLITAPSTGYVDLVIMYATTRTGNGNQEQEFYFSADAGANWTLVEPAYYIPFYEDEEEESLYAEMTIDISDYIEANNNPDLHFKVLFVGEGNDNTSGNNRFDNISLEGKPIMGGEPAKVVITSINNDDDVYVGQEFSIDISIVDEEGLPAVVDEDVTVALSVEAGTGELGGNTTAVVEAGKFSVSIASVTYSVAEQGVVIKAAASGMEVAISEAFDVLPVSYVLELQSNIPEAGELAGGGEYAEGEEVTIEATPNEGFKFLNWSIGEEELSSNPVYIFTMPAEDTFITANFETTTDDEPILIHYWHFNDLADETHFEVESDYSAVGQGLITYPGTGEGYMDIRTHRPGDPVSNFNLRMDQEPDQGAILRVRNPANTRELLFKVPSTGFENLMVTFATTRSGSGGQEQEFYFSPDNGSSWTQVGDAYNVYEHDPDATNFGFEHKIFDLSGYPEINDNAELVIRIMSVGAGSDGDSGNQRFDNFSVDAYSIQK